VLLSMARTEAANNHNLSQKWAAFYIACNRDFATVIRTADMSRLTRGELKYNSLQYLGQSERLASTLLWEGLERVVEASAEAATVTN
jgi:hypothetical protein